MLFFIDPIKKILNHPSSHQLYTIILLEKNDRYSHLTKNLKCYVLFFCFFIDPIQKHTTTPHRNPKQIRLAIQLFTIILLENNSRDGFRVSLCTELQNANVWAYKNIGIPCQVSTTCSGTQVSNQIRPCSTGKNLWTPKPNKLTEKASLEPTFLMELKSLAKISELNIS